MIDDKFKARIDDIRQSLEPGQLYDLEVPTYPGQLYDIDAPKDPKLRKRLMFLGCKKHKFGVSYDFLNITKGTKETFSVTVLGFLYKVKE